MCAVHSFCVKFFDGLVGGLQLLNLPALSGPSAPVVAQRPACQNHNLIQELHLLSLSVETCVEDETVDSSGHFCREEFSCSPPDTHRTTKSLLNSLAAVGIALSPAVGPLFHPLWVLSFTFSLSPNTDISCGLLVLVSPPPPLRSTRKRVTRPSLRSSCATPCAATVICQTRAARGALSAPTVRLHVVGRPLRLLCLVRLGSGCALRQSLSRLVARSALLGASVSRSLSCSSGPCAGRQSALLDCVTRLFDRPVCVTVEPSVVHHVCACLGNGTPTSCHVLHVASVCALSCSRVPELHGLGMFPSAGS